MQGSADILNVGKYCMKFIGNFLPFSAMKEFSLQNYLVKMIDAVRAKEWCVATSQLS